MKVLKYIIENPISFIYNFSTSIICLQLLFRVKITNESIMAMVMLSSMYLGSKINK
jgi:hypothetical protein